MKVTLESTDLCVELVIHGCRIPARIWEGRTAGGIKCHAYITRIAVQDQDDATEFEKDLEQCQPPSPDVTGIPPRLIL